jgi:hypothetical protein
LLFGHKELFKVIFDLSVSDPVLQDLKEGLLGGF